jgi:hypothetical protein
MSLFFRDHHGRGAAAPRKLLRSSNSRKLFAHRAIGLTDSPVLTVLRDHRVIRKPFPQNNFVFTLYCSPGMAGFGFLRTDVEIV